MCPLRITKVSGWVLLETRGRLFLAFGSFLRQPPQPATLHAHICLVSDLLPSSSTAPHRPMATPGSFTSSKIVSLESQLITTLIRLATFIFLCQVKSHILRLWELGRGLF